MTAELTSTERLVRDLIVQGLTSAEMASRMYLGVRTIETHRNSVRRKMGARNVADVVRLAMLEQPVPSSRPVVWEQPYDTVL